MKNVVTALHDCKSCAAFRCSTFVFDTYGAELPFNDMGWRY